MRNKLDIEYPVQIDKSLIGYLKCCSKKHFDKLSKEDVQNIKKLINYQDIAKNNFLHLYIEYIFKIDLQAFGFLKISRIRILALILSIERTTINRTTHMVNSKNKIGQTPFEMLLSTLDHTKAYNSSFTQFIFLMLTSGVQLKKALQNKKLRQIFILALKKKTLYFKPRRRTRVKERNNYFISISVRARKTQRETGDRS